MMSLFCSHEFLFVVQLNYKLCCCAKTGFYILLLVSSLNVVIFYNKKKHLASATDNCFCHQSSTNKNNISVYPMARDWNDLNRGDEQARQEWACACSQGARFACKRNWFVMQRVASATVSLCAVQLWIDCVVGRRKRIELADGAIR